MKIILLEDIRGKGKKDDIIEVASGYATHLIRNKQAVEASKGGLKKLDNQKAARDAENEKLKEEAIKNKEILEKKPLEFQLKVGSDGRVFKSISSKQIVERVQKDFGIKLDKRKFKTKDTVNSLGVTNVDIELFKGVVATIKVAIKEQ